MDLKQPAPQIMNGSVMHSRLFPKENSFRYNIYYVALPLSRLQDMPLAYNKWGIQSFHDKDHGECDGTPLEPWARAILKEYSLHEIADGEITLVTMPRVFGYVFNPVSFWLCVDKGGHLRAVICEVHNTFGERHSYICAHDDGRIITNKDVICAQKLFHVSPFLQREGQYKFKFQIDKEQFSVFIDFYNKDEKKQLVTYLKGAWIEMTDKELMRAFKSAPLVPLKAILLIHWQALKLITKGIKYIKRPKQFNKKVSKGGDEDKIIKNF
jgi:hypothetical protein